VDAYRSFIAQRFEEEVNSLSKGTKEIQPSKKRTNPFKGSIFKYFSIKYSFKKKDVSVREFLKDLCL
jgi:hypothetical protein